MAGAKDKPVPNPRSSLMKARFDRHIFLMLSAAVAVAIPLVWLQSRWLRRIDPELEK